MTCCFFTSSSHSVLPFAEVKSIEVAREPAAGSEKNRLENWQPVWKGYNWASEACPTLGCSIEISRNIAYYTSKSGICVGYYMLLSVIGERS